MRRYTSRPRDRRPIVITSRDNPDLSAIKIAPLPPSPHDADIPDLDDGYERHHPSVEVSGERQPYWCGLYDHRGDEIWVTERRQLGFVQEDDD